MENAAQALEKIDVRSAIKRAFTGGPGYFGLLTLFVLMIIIGAGAGFHALHIVGSHHAYGVSRDVPWGILISTYIFFVVTSTGLCLVSSIGHVFGMKDFMPIAKRSVFLSVVTILSGFYVIFFEIENPFRMAIYNVISPNLTSNIWWMGTLYGAYLFFMAIEFVFIMLGQHKIATVAGFLGVISGGAAHSNLGGIFATLHGREYWYGPYLPFYFIASAMMTGCAFIIFFTYLAYKLRNESLEPPVARSLEVTTKLGVLLIVIIMFLTTWKIVTGFTGGAQKVETLHAMLSGPYSTLFWGVEVLMGMMIPVVLYLLSGGKRLGLMFLGSAVMIVAIFFMRYDLVVIGQIVPGFHELGVNEYKGLLTYTPSLHEIAVVLGGMGFAGAAFLIGERVFDGFKDDEEHGH